MGIGSTVNMAKVIKSAITSHKILPNTNPLTVPSLLYKAARCAPAVSLCFEGGNPKPDKSCGVKGLKHVRPVSPVNLFKA